MQLTLILSHWRFDYNPIPPQEMHSAFLPLTESRGISEKLFEQALFAPEFKYLSAADGHLCLSVFICVTYLSTDFEKGAFEVCVITKENISESTVSTENERSRLFQACSRYMAFSEKADKDGYPGVSMPSCSKKHWMIPGQCGCGVSYLS